MDDIDGGHDFGVDWVDVHWSPTTLSSSASTGIRVFEVVIEPGCCTQFHRHNRDTIYVRANEWSIQIRTTRTAAHPGLVGTLHWVVHPGLSSRPPSL